MINLYDYQLKAISRMGNGCILNGGVGSGKSMTSIAYYFVENGGKVNTEYYEGMTNIQNLYIITTARKRDTFEWDKDLAPFQLSTNPEFNIYSKQGLSVIVDSWNNIDKYSDIEDAFFIFDEQRVVGNGVWVKSFLKITKSNNWILLSATPGDTWSDYIPVFIANGFYRNRSDFNQQHIVWKRFTKFPQIDRYINTGRLIRLRNNILVEMDFERSTVAHHENIHAGYNKQAYKLLNKERWNMWDKKPIENASEFCYCLRRLVNSDVSRSVSVLEIMEKHPRAIIFYNFDYELEILKNLGYMPGTEVAEWNGHKHQPVPEGEQWAYLVQYTAGCEGWNCVKTDTIIFYSQNYSYKVMEQASGRIDRLNTPFKDLYYYHIKSNSGIDLGISKALSEKKKFNETKYVNSL